MVDVRKFFGRGNPSAKKKVIGRFLDEQSPPREFVGEVKPGGADASDAQLYQLSVADGSKAPIIQSKTSERFWTLDWPKLLALAVRDGVDKPIEARPEVKE